MNTLVTTVAWSAILLFSFNFFQVLMKKVQEGAILIVLFWLHFFSLITYTIRSILQASDQGNISNFFYNIFNQFTPYNTLMYTLFGCCFLGVLIFYHNLIAKFPVSIVVPFLRLTFFIALPILIVQGITVSWAHIVTGIFVLVGALIFGMKTFDINDLLKSIKSIPRNLLLWGFSFAIFKAFAGLTLSYASQTNAPQAAISITKSFTHIFPFAFYTPFDIGIGLRIFKVLPLFLYIVLNKKYAGKLFLPFYMNKTQLLLLPLVFLVSLYSFEVLDSAVQNKSLFIFIDTLNLPVIILLAKTILLEPLTETKTLGTIVTLIGGLIPLFFS